MYTVYILKSQITERFYVGYSSDVSARLSKHNAGSTRSTRPYRPWEIVYTEICSDRKAAWLRERQIKSYKGGEAFKKLLQSGGFA